MTYQDRSTEYADRQLFLMKSEATAEQFFRFNEPEFFGMDNETFVQMIKRKASEEVFPDVRIVLYQCATMIEDQQNEIRRLTQQIQEMGGVV